MDAAIFPVKYAPNKTVWYASTTLKKELPGQWRIFPKIQNMILIPERGKLKTEKISLHRNEGTPKFKN